MRFLQYVDSMMRNDVLQIVVFSVIFAFAVSAMGKKGQPILEFAESLSQVMFTFTSYIMMFAPFGIGAAMAVTIGHMGVGVLVNLGMLVATLYLALIGVCCGCVWRCSIHHKTADQTICTSNERTIYARVCYHQQRICFAQTHGNDGTHRRAQTHRGIRHSNRIQF